MGLLRSLGLLNLSWFNVHLRFIFTLLALTVFIAGCSGITPTELRNDREEGPQQGLFTGSAGELVIFRHTPPDAKPRKTGDTDKVGE